MDDLATLLAAARAPGAERITYRDRIAAFGAPAVDAMGEWLGDPALAPFAVRVLGRVEGPARAAAIDALVDAALTSAIPGVSGDAEEELIRMGEATRLKKDKEVIVLEEGEDAVGRAFMRVRMRAADSGHFTLPEVVMTGLHLPTNPRVEVEVTCRAGTFSVITKTESRNEVYARQRDPATRDLERIRPYERIEVVISRAPEPGEPRPANR